MLTAYQSASDGATYTFAAGTYNWTSRENFWLTEAKAGTWICAVQHACDVTVDALAPFFIEDIEGVHTKLWRISGFEFIGGTTNIIDFHRYLPSGIEYMTNVRIDHNRFTNRTGSTASINFSGGMVVYGLIDNNEQTSTSSEFLFVGGPNPYSCEPSCTQLDARGGANNLFVEDNTITHTAPSGTPACVDAEGMGYIVWRYNIMTNCFIASHGTTHGGGPLNFETYNNTFILTSVAAAPDGERLFQHQGSGEIYLFNNSFTAYSGKSNDAAIVQHYRSGDPVSWGYSTAESPINEECNATGTTNAPDGQRVGMPAGQEGYPCWHQPGRNAADEMMPMYAWNNYWADTGAKINLVKSADDAHVLANRDYHNAISKDAQTSPTSPWDGTHSGFVAAGNYGMGFGTLANRPTTCTANAIALDAGFGGVGYFATDQGAQGKLYRCSATDTWTLHYEPYTYPHPLSTP
jgi:hypothetical protein